MMKMSPNEAYYILKHLDAFITNFEDATAQKMTPGAVQILHEILLDAAFPTAGSEQLH